MLLICCGSVCCVVHFPFIVRHSQSFCALVACVCASHFRYDDVQGGESAIHFAAYKGYVDIVNVFLSHGVDINIIGSVRLIILCHCGCVCF